MSYKGYVNGLVLACVLSGCSSGSTEQPGPTRVSLADARRGFVTRIVATGGREPPAPAPPPGIFNLIRYKSPAGDLAAYVTPDPGDGAKHPAIVWITGGDCNSINELWGERPRSNDQTAAPYRKVGIVTMFPSLRGGN